MKLNQLLESKEGFKKLLEIQSDLIEEFDMPFKFRSIDDEEYDYVFYEPINFTYNSIDEIIGISDRRYHYPNAKDLVIRLLTINIVKQQLEFLYIDWDNNKLVCSDILKVIQILKNIDYEEIPTISLTQLFFKNNSNRLQISITEINAPIYNIVLYFIR